MIVALGNASFSPAFATPSQAPATSSYAGKAVDFTVYLWAGLSLAAVVWALKSSPAAKRRRGEIQRAQVRLRKARRLPRVGV